MTKPTNIRDALRAKKQMVEDDPNKVGALVDFYRWCFGQQTEMNWKNYEGGLPTFQWMGHINKTVGGHRRMCAMMYEVAGRDVAGDPLLYIKGMHKNWKNALDYEVVSEEQEVMHLAAEDPLVRLFQSGVPQSVHILSSEFGATHVDFNRQLTQDSRSVFYDFYRAVNGSKESRTVVSTSGAACRTIQDTWVPCSRPIPDTAEEVVAPSEEAKVECTEEQLDVFNRLTMSMEEKVPAPTFKSLFSDWKLIAITDSHMVVRVENSFKKEQIVRFKNTILTSLRQMGFSELMLQIDCES